MHPSWYLDPWFIHPNYYINSLLKPYFCTIIFCSLLLQNSWVVSCSGQRSWSHPWLLFFMSQIYSFGNPLSSIFNLQIHLTISHHVCFYTASSLIIIFCLDYCNIILNSLHKLIFYNQSLQSNQNNVSQSFLFSKTLQWLLSLSKHRVLPWSARTWCAFPPSVSPPSHLVTKARGHTACLMPGQ